eukprot:TRINITY_DN22126_c0_g1_i1.p1 TRINITY_DN22126_c0_g1~~TRINITY_DN22126_c0_g1_i1.p1  ORF type:complete len:130 (+),score=7.53 TRINITY_DN22126_c0_g1_i1:65-454(+)
MKTRPLFSGPSHKKYNSKESPLSASSTVQLKSPRISTFLRSSSKGVKTTFQDEGTNERLTNIDEVIWDDKSSNNVRNDVHQKGITRRSIKLRDMFTTRPKRARLQRSTTMSEGLVLDPTGIPDLPRTLR